MQKVNIKSTEEITNREKFPYEEIKTKSDSKISITDIFLNGIAFISFSGLLILSWLSLIWLYKYHYVVFASSLWFDFLLLYITKLIHYYLAFFQ